MISIVIVNWNAGSQIQDCINSIQAYEEGLVDKVIVVDNGSTDGSAESLLPYEKLHIEYARENLGFGKACNRGVALTESKYLLFLNPDACLFPGTLKEVVSFLEDEQNREIGICGVKLVDDKGHVNRSCSRFPRPRDFVFHSLGIDRFIPKLGYLMTDWSHTESSNVDHVIGAFYMVRKVTFASIGGFDERFFLYLEDLDFSLRANRAGWNSFYFALTSAFHRGGGTSAKIKAKRIFYSIRSRIEYSNIHFSSLGVLIVVIAAFTVEPFARMLLNLGRMSFSGVVETAAAYVMLGKWGGAKLFARLSFLSKWFGQRLS